MSIRKPDFLSTGNKSHDENDRHKKEGYFMSVLQCSKLISTGYKFAGICFISRHSNKMKWININETKLYAPRAMSNIKPVYLLALCMYTCYRKWVDVCMLHGNTKHLCRNTWSVIVVFIDQPTDPKSLCCTTKWKWGGRDERNVIDDRE